MRDPQRFEYAMSVMIFVMLVAWVLACVGVAL